VSVNVSQRSLSAARRDINARLNNIRANVNVVVNPVSVRSAAALNANLTNLNQTLTNVTASATSAATAIRDLSAAMRAAGGGANALTQINTALNVTTNNASSANASIRNMSGEIENFGRQAGLAIRRFAAFTTVTSVFYGLARSVQSGLSAFIEFDRQLVRISQVTGDSLSSIKNLSNSITSLSQLYGVSSEKLAEVAVVLAQAGLSAKETQQSLASLAKTTLAPSFDNINDTVEGSIALMRQFGIQSNQLEQALGSVNAVAAKFAVEAGDIIAAIQRTGGVFAAASKGVSEGTDALNEFISVFTSVRATTRESAETIATGLRTIFTRIQRGGTIEALKDFGISLTDVEGKFVGAYKAVELLSTGLSKLDPRDLRFSQIVEELGGFRQIGKVIPLIQQFATAQDALRVAQTGAGSLSEDAAKGQLALAVQIARVREEFLALIRSVGDTSSFRTLVKLGLDLASSLVQVADAAKELIPLIGAFAAFRGAQSLTRFAAGFAGGIRGTPARGFASGGYVPGSGNRDTVPAMLTPGEFVIRKKAVEKIGVSSLSRLNRNNGGPVPAQYFEDGGQVQRFGIGGVAKKGVNWKNLSKGRGKKGPRGPRARFDLPQPGDADFAKWQREVYAEYDADPSLPRVRVNGIPMPPEIAYVNELIGEEIFRQNFRSRKSKKSGKLKKTPLGLIISAAKMPRGPRAPAGEMEKIMAGYQQSPEFQKEAVGAGSSLFSTLKGPLASFKKGGTFGGVIAPGSENATKIKGALAKLLSQSSGQDATKAKTALDKFDSFIAGSTPEKPGHVSHFTWAMNQIFKKGIATFGRGGRASRRMGVFDFDMTTGITKQKETPSLSGFRDPKLAVPDILGATPTGLVGLMRRYGASQILTARSGGPRGEMRRALGTFFRRSGVMLPQSNIITLGDQVGSLSTAEKKARALYAIVKKYGKVDFFDDDTANIDAAKMVRGVSARKVSVMKNLGGFVQKFMAGKAVKRMPDLPPDIKALITREARLGIGKEDPALQSALLNLVAKRNRSVGTTELASRLAGLIKSNQLTPRLANQMLSTGGLAIPTGPGGKTTIQALSLEALGPKDTTKYTRNIGGRETDILRASPTPDLSARLTRDLVQGTRIGIARFIRTGLTEYAMQSPENRRSLIDRGIKFDSKGRAIPPRSAVDAAMSHGDAGNFLGPLFEKGIIGLGAQAGPSLPGKAAPIDTSRVGDIVASIMRGGAPISAELPTELRAAKAKTRASAGIPNINKRGLVNQILRFFKLPGLKFAQGGLVPGVSSSRAREAILGKQLSGVEMIRAARRAGYDIEELDNGLIRLSRNNKTMHTLSRQEASKLLGSMTTGYNLGGMIQKFARGGSPKDTVPALLTPGEFVINKKAAARLGSSKLHRLNKADKISGFNTGGEVGRVPTFSSGGDVQRFFFGGRASARPGTEANTSNLMIAGNVTTQLREVATALQELGAASSASADILRRGGRISVESANAAYEADILRMRVAGAPMDAVIQAETRLANMRRQAQTQVAAQRQLAGVGGAQLERVDTTAQQNIQRMIQRAQNSGVDLNEAQRARIEDLGYRRAAQAGGLSAAQTAGLSGNDIRQFINSAMGDPRTFEQMNRQFEARRRAELNNQYIAENRFGGDRRRILQQASRDAAEEARIRRQTLNQTRGAAGPGGTRGQRMQQGMFAASFALPMLAQMLAGDPSRATSAGGAAMSAGIQGGANALALGTMLSSLVPPGLPQVFVGVATAAGAVAQGFIDARNATIEFEKNMSAKKVEFAIADTVRLFDKLSKDIKNIDVQNAIGDKLVEAAKAAERSIEIQSNTARAFWINMIDAFASNGREAAQRAQILEKYGTTAYLSTTTIGQSFMGGSGTAQQRAERRRSNFAMEMAPEQAREISRQFSEIADSSNKLLEEKIRSGLNIEQYINTDEFKGLSQAIALSNAAIAEQILNIRASTVLTQAQKTAQEKLIISTYAEQEARKRAAAITRELEIKQAQKVVNQLARSLDRMFGNMEQAINKTNFALEKMSRDLDLVSSSLTGQAKLGERSIQAINVLQNPRAYGSGELNMARGQAAGFFGDSGNIIRGLLTLGDDIEANIMGTINRTLRDTRDDSPGKIAIAIQKSVKEKLAGLALPKDLSDKLAREVSKALEEIRKDGEDQADFTQLEEKLQDLNKIIDSTTKAQDIAIKALETWQNALNSYSSSMNSLVDLQIDYQSRLRTSNDILLDGQASLARSLGKDIGLESIANRRNLRIAQQTGGATAPQDIFRNINRLELLRAQQENASNVAAQRGPSGAKDFVEMQNNLRSTNVALRENFDALKNLAENSDLASAALNKIQEAQQRQQGKVSFIEKLVTSTPEELSGLNRAFVRLQNNINGQVNTINNSVGAQRAYIEAIRSGSNAFEAMKAAQDAFANERRETLSALNDILPFLGGGNKANQIRANTLESMLAESGVGVSPMFQDILNSLRDPELDPETQKAIALYEQANILQVKANDFLAQINLKLGEQTAEAAAKAIATALSSVVLTFKNAEQADINRGLIPQNRAKGGIIYASKGVFAPKGTDTVPAMLTPGEFVVNKNATAKNLPLLKSINSQTLSSGGKVKYYARGGLVSSYLSTNAQSRDDFQQTKDKFLDLSENEQLFQDVSKTSLFRLPSTYIRKPQAGLQTPSKSSPARERYDDRPNKYRLKELYSNSGEILPGYVTSKIDLGPYYYSVPSMATVANRELGKYLEPVNLIPAGIKTTILGLDSTDLDISSKKYSKKDFAEYKKKLETLNIERFNWINNPASFALRALEGVTQEYPSNIDPTALNNRFFDPNSKQKLSSIYPSDAGLRTSSVPFKYAKILSDNRSDYFGITTGSIGTEPPNGDFSSGPTLSKTIDTMWAKVWNIDKNKALSPQRAKDILNYNRKQFKLINKTVQAAKDNFKDIELEDSGELKDYFELQQQLGNLYNNFSIYEDFNKLDLFANPLLSNAKSLTVLSNTSVARSDLKKYIENQQAQLAQGVAPDNNDNPILIGLRDPLPPDLQDATNKWVKKTEFDIFSRDGTGPVKTFPFLINADARDLGEGFMKRAAVALQAQKDAIETSMVIDNNKMTLTLGAGKNIELPYSATYTKYSGPLWDLNNNTFSDDKNKQLKDLFLPDKGAENSIFSSLDTNGSRLFKRGGVFDLNNIQQSIPADNINKLIDLVKNNSEQNLIDKEIQNIKNQSSLTFRHIGDNQGSLIKLQRAIGKEVFVGYSQLANTPVDFGAFVAQGVIDYAKNLKQEAGIAAGRAQGADDQDRVVSDVPMALQQLTKGALNVFGRRPIPGIGRGWLANNIRPLIGLMSRQGRGRAPGLTNDQARGASAYIRDVMNNVGGYVNQISGRVSNPVLYNSLKDTLILIQGAYKSFDALARSDSADLAQMLKSNLDPESIFRSFGSGAMLDRIAMSELSGDYKNILGQQLRGSKIATVGDNGDIKLQEAANLEFRNYKDLIKLAINPYNEFSSVKTRRGIFGKLTNDISGAVDNRGMPYFDPNTLNFLLTSLNQLDKWYGGVGPWLGQDYLFDKTLDPDPATRSQKFLASLQKAQGIYELSNVAYQNLGGAGKFGPVLPNKEWFQNRIDAGNFATGGMVYASGGTLVNYQPRGTDTVPAMLTPGEFVVNRSATRKNLPLLQQINSGYLAEGGMAESAGVSRLRWTPEGRTRAIEQKDTITPKLNNINKNVLNNFTSITSIQKDIKNIKDSINNNTQSLQQTISLLNIKFTELQNLSQALAPFVYSQLLVALRNFWSSLGTAIITQGLGNGAPWPPAPFSDGGIVYASKGQLINFQPKGTDTVPAMLTPGEFVVNAKATKNNLGLLQSINNGVGGYNRGGVVYLEDGGLTPGAKQSLIDLQNQGYNLQDIVSGKTRIPGIIVETSKKQYDPMMPTKPAPNIETYRENPKLWNGFKDSSGFWWNKRGESVISAYGTPPVLPNFQERMQAFESIVSAFAGAGGVGGGRGKLADVRGLPAGMPMQRNAPGPLGTKVAIPYLIGRPNPNNAPRANSMGLTLDAIRDPLTGNYYVSDTPARNITISGRQGLPAPKTRQRTKSPLDLENGKIPDSITNPKSKEFMHLAIKEMIGYTEFMNLVKLKVQRSDRTYSSLLKFLALDIFPKGNAYGVDSLDKAISFFNTPEGIELYNTKISPKIGVVPEIGGYNASIINQNSKTGGGGITGRLLKELFQQNIFHISKRSANVPDDLNSRMASLIPPTAGLLYDDNIAKLLSSAGVTPKVDSNRVSYVFDVAEAGKDWGLLTPDQRAHLQQFAPKATGSESSNMKRGQLRTSSRERLGDGPPSLSKFGTATPKKSFHGSGSEIIQVDPMKLNQGMLGEGFYVGFDANEAPINFLKMRLDSWLLANKLKPGNITPEQLAQFKGGIYPVDILGGIDDFLAADQILKDNPAALAKIENIYKDLGLRKVSLGPIEYKNDPTTGRAKAVRTEGPLDLPSATVMQVYDNIQNQLAAKYETEFAGKSNIPDPRFEALTRSATDMRNIFVKYGIPGFTDLNNARSQGSMAAIFDLNRIKLGKAYIPDKILKEIMMPIDQNTYKDIDGDLEILESVNKKKGGIIYASKGQFINFQPRGTDTVPAMLTPGEFVVNRTATQKNLPLLKAINSGVDGYSNGGVVYLAAGGRPQRTTRDKNKLDIREIDNRFRSQMTSRNAQQMAEAAANREGKLWVFMVKTRDNNGAETTGFLTKDPNNPNQPAPKNIPPQTESLLANRLDEIFTLRARNEKEAMDAYKEMNVAGLLPEVKPASAQQALNKARKKWMQQPLYAKIFDELAYQINLDRNQFSIFNPDFFNRNVNVDENIKPIMAIVDNMDPNNPASVALGVPAILTKLRPIVQRINYLRHIIRNNEQALTAVKSAIASGLNINDPANMRKAFEGNPATKINEEQLNGAKPELAGGEQVLNKLGTNPVLANLGRDPRFKEIVSTFGYGPGVAVSTFERRVEQMAAPPKLLASGGRVTYASNGQLINFQPRGTDTVPAMLTPGEFVVNREAANKHLSLLQAINNNNFANDSVLTLSRGGFISPAYLRNGGSAPSLAGLSDMVSKLTQSIQSAVETAITKAFENSELLRSNSSDGVSDNGAVVDQIAAFTRNLGDLANRLETISVPPEITIQGRQDINVNANGLQVLSSLDPSMKQLAMNMIKTAFDNLATKNPGTLDFNVDYP
jgi:TP901 family phage tail tape measure protein